MSTTTTQPQLDISGTQRVPFGRLVKVELRKMVDTRGGFWLLLITGLLLLITVALVLLVIGLEDDASIGASGWAQILTLPLSILLPVFAIQTVTSEWSQRTGLVTFTLEPHRGRVLLAKLSTVVILAMATIVVAFVLGVIGNLVGAALAGGDADWSITARDLITTILLQLLYFLMAFALATVILNTPGAIAVFYVVALLLPTMVYGILYAIFDWAQSLIPWIDLQYASTPFFDPDQSVGGLDVARMVTATCLWIVLPLLLGMRRIFRSEPK